jgi:hypothetical protein
MKLIRPNIYFYSIKIIVLLVASVFTFFLSTGQTVYTDTANVEVSDTVVNSTTAQETPNYFEYKTYGEQPDTIELRAVPAGVVDSLKNDDAFWYANAKLKKEREESNTANGTPKWIKTAVWVIIIAAFLAALIWYLVSSNIVIFARTQKQIMTEKEDEELEEDIFHINYQREIEKAIAGANHRLAVRLMFLRLLRNLSDKKVIQYRPERTNFDYLSQLSPTGYYNDFFKLARNYEYVWYGKFDISPEAFATIKNDFEIFERILK